MEHPGKPIVVKGKKYACVESGIPVEPACYKAKSKKEFEKLSRQQDKGKGKPLKISGKFYSCIQNN